MTTTRALELPNEEWYLGVAILPFTSAAIEMATWSWRKGSNPIIDQLLRPLSAAISLKCQVQKRWHFKGDYREESNAHDDCKLVIAHSVFPLYKQLALSRIICLFFIVSSDTAKVEGLFFLIYKTKPLY